MIGRNKVKLFKSKIRKVSMTHPKYNWAKLTPFYLLKWTSWSSLKSYCWTIPYSKCKTKPWEIKTPSGRNGGKLFKSSQKNIFRTICNWLALMNKGINLNCNHMKLLSFIQVQTSSFVFVEIGTNNKVPTTPYGTTC